MKDAQEFWQLPVIVREFKLAFTLGPEIQWHWLVLTG